MEVFTAFCVQHSGNASISSARLQRPFEQRLSLQRRVAG